MDLKDWEDRYYAFLEKHIENYIKDMGDDLVVPNPLQSKNQQLLAYRQKLQKLLHSEEVEEQFIQALKLINEKMPYMMPKEVWEQVFHDFSGCEANLLKFLEVEREGNSEEKGTGELLPLYKMYGLSSLTLEYCYDFGNMLFEQGSYAEAKLLMLFLIRLAPLAPEFWISAAICDVKMKDFSEAAEILKLAASFFPDNLPISLYLADNYLALGETANAKHQLELAKKILEREPSNWDTWKPMYDQLAKQAR